jgi:hypothetical protein
MKAATIVLALAIAPAWAQVAQTVAAIAPGEAKPCARAAGPTIAPQTFVELEHRFNDELSSFQDPIDTFGGNTRAVYLRDYGLVMTTEISLIQAPAISPFRREIGKEEVGRVHARKVAQLPLLKQEMRRMIKTSALTMTGAVGLQKLESSGLEVVIAVRLLYLPYEDTTGLPAQIIMRADLKNAIAGQIDVEE